jgi:hypothetical protein
VLRAEWTPAVVRSRELITAAQNSIRHARRDVSSGTLLRACVATAHALGYLEAMALSETDPAASIYRDIEEMGRDLQGLALVLSRLDVDD